jgi:hypothetical protein
MSEETQAVSSPAEVEDVFKGEQRQPERVPEVSSEWRAAREIQTSRTRRLGHLLTRRKRGTEGEDPEPAPDSDPEEAQEQPQKALQPKSA